MGNLGLNPFPEDKGFSGSPSKLPPLEEGSCLPKLCFREGGWTPKEIFTGDV
jgi:hypothetical protein